ncbi:hypothetical protein BC830DRAFT_963284 [Chytriomyces sp. MP71]|nr:hypothetical protein BC830DRAFT_963284 [Chytriomyces sp. MP71]
MKSRIRCIRCSTSHRTCDKTYPQCARCTRDGVQCHYREAKAFGFTCDECRARHRKCDRNSRGCGHCLESGIKCSYTRKSYLVLEKGEGAGVAGPHRHITRMTTSRPTPTQQISGSNSQEPIKLSSELPVTPSMLAASLQGDGEFSIPASPILVAPYLFPTFDEWRLVHSYLNSHDPQVQDSLAHFILAKETFVKEFFQEPCALWWGGGTSNAYTNVYNRLIVCAHALRDSSLESLECAHTYFVRSKELVETAGFLNPSLQTIQTFLLVSSFAYLSFEEEIGECYFHTAVELAELAGISVDLGSTHWRTLVAKLKGLPLDINF